MNKLFCFFFVLLTSGASAADYPKMTGEWTGSIRVVSSGEQVRQQVARGGALIQKVALNLTVSYQDEEVFIGQTTSDLPNSVPIPIWGAVRSTGKEGVFVTANGGRENIWFNESGELEFCFANQSQEQMSAYCGELRKQPEEKITAVSMN